MMSDDSASCGVAGAGEGSNELEKRGLSVALDFLRDPDIKPDGDRIGEIIIGQMTVPDLQGIAWPDLFLMMQETAAQERVPGQYSSKNEHRPIYIAPDLPTRVCPLPKPGCYEIGVWRLGGERIPGGYDMSISDTRSFRTEAAARELQASGFTGAVNLFMLAHVTKALLMLEGERFTLGEAGDRFLLGKTAYTPRYSFNRKTVDVLAGIPIDWRLRFFQIDDHCSAESMVFGFRPVTK